MIQNIKLNDFAHRENNRPVGMKCADPIKLLFPSLIYSFIFIFIIHFSANFITITQGKLCECHLIRINRITFGPNRFHLF